MTILFITTRYRNVFFCKYNAQYLAWNWWSMEDCLPFHSLTLPFHSILASSIFHTEIFVPFHFLFHSIPCPGCRFYINIIIVTFYPTVVARLKIWKRMILKKLLPLPAPFQHFRCRVRFRFQPFSSECFRFHKNLTASTASASSFRFHIPGNKPYSPQLWAKSSIRKWVLEYFCVYYATSKGFEERQRTFKL